MKTESNNENMVPWYVYDFLRAIRARLMIKLSEEGHGLSEYDPFGSTGKTFNNDTFEVYPNGFKYDDFEVSWDGYFGNKMSQNRFIDTYDACLMLDDCIDSLNMTPTLWVCWCNACGTTISYRGAVPDNFICACKNDNKHEISYQDW
jgi:hypothetical protein